MGVVLSSSVLRVLYVQERPAPPVGAAVLVTGCDTGFGRGVAITLSRMGYRVLAGCLTSDACASLPNEAATRNLLAFQLDVTKEADVAKAAALVEHECPEGLYGLINNAGINSGSLVDWNSMGDFRATMEVNFFGMVAMTKALLPHLRKLKDRSRIINVTSVCAFLSIPGMAAYSSSKHAAQAFNDALRRELRPWNIAVIAIQPGFMRTPIVTSAKNVVQRTWETLDSAQKAVYGQPFYEEYATETVKNAEMMCSNPTITIDAICDAFLSTHPKDVYRVGIDLYLYNVLRSLPSFLSDWLIGWQSYPTKVKPATA